MELKKVTIHGNQVWYLCKEENIKKHLNLDLDDLIDTSNLIRDELKKMGLSFCVLK